MTQGRGLIGANLFGERVPPVFNVEKMQKRLAFGMKNSMDFLKRPRACYAL